MKQIATIEWLPYPENKPENSGRILLIKTSNNDETTTGWFSKEGATYVEPHKTYKEKWNDSHGRKLKDVIAYAELPKAYDPTANTFNFQTALALMRETWDKRCKCKDKIYRVNENGFLMVGTIQGWLQAYLSLAEIEGEWELV